MSYNSENESNSDSEEYESLTMEYFNSSFKNKKLSAENKKQLYIPKGFAHGYSVLSETAEVFYKCDAFYNKSLEAGVQFYDPNLNIDWKIPEEKRIISDKDMLHPTFENCINNFIF